MTDTAIIQLVVFGGMLLNFVTFMLTRRDKKEIVGLVKDNTKTNEDALNAANNFHVTSNSTAQLAERTNQTAVDSMVEVMTELRLIKAQGADNTKAIGQLRLEFHDCLNDSRGNR